MSDDQEIETTTPETKTESAPELTDEQVAAYLASKVGREVAPSDLERFANLDAMAREVMREKSDFGRQKKAAPPAPATEDDVDLESIDPKTRKLLDKLIEQTVVTRFGESLSLPAIQAEEDVESAIDDFMDKHDDVAPEALAAVIRELEGAGIRPAKPTRGATTKFLKTAYDIAKSRAIDIESIKKAAYDEALDKIAAENAEKGEVVAVEKKRGTSEKVDKDKEAESLGFWGRLSQ